MRGTACHVMSSVGQSLVSPTVVPLWRLGWRKSGARVRRNDVTSVAGGRWWRHSIAEMIGRKRPMEKCDLPEEERIATVTHPSYSF